jgi:hypothetical protein
MVWGGIRDNRSVEASAWTHRERDVPHRGPRPTADQVAEIMGKPPIALRPLFELPVAPHVAAAAAIPVERIRGPVLLFSGQEDRMWPASAMCDAVIERLAKHGHAHAFAHHRYPGAGHLLRAPCMPTSVVDAPTWALGGNPRGQALANRQSWTALLRTLAGEVQ